MTATQYHLADRLKETGKLYLLTKEIIIFLEKYNKGGYACIRPHSEVRNAFGGAMKMG
jgi:hypothetical protein